jgi:hypothetical protein
MHRFVGQDITSFFSHQDIQIFSPHTATDLLFVPGCGILIDGTRLCDPGKWANELEIAIGLNSKK